MPELPDLGKVISDNEARLMRYASRYLREPQDARDAVQEAFIKFVKAAQAKQAIENAEAWLFRVARNICLDFLKSKRRKVEVSLDEGMDCLNDGSGNPDEEASAMDDMKMLKRLVEGLNESERETLCLKLEHGKSYKEIADITGQTVSNVGFILHNAMKKMQKAYRELDASKPAKAALPEGD